MSTLCFAPTPRELQMGEALHAVVRRARASFAGPSTSFAPPRDGPPSHQQENAGVIPRKRSQSLGGPLAEMQHGRNNSLDEGEASLSPRKRARRSLVPGRSILRKSLGPTAVLAFGDDATMTYTGPATMTARHDSTETFDGNTDHRKSLARRVSFAPAAHMREFAKDEPEDVSLEQSSSPPAPPPAPIVQPQQPSPRRQSIAPRRQSALTRFEENLADQSEMSMEMADTSITAAFDTRSFGGAAGALLDEEEPEYGDDSEMSMVTNDVTAAFAANTIIIAQQQQQPQLPPSDEATSSQDEEEDVAHSLGATAGGHVEYSVPLHPPGVAPPSTDSVHEASYEDEEEDEQLQGQKPQYAPQSEDEDATMEMELDAGAAGLVVEDGFTSRRLSVSGAVRRASLAPGHAALALLDATEEEDEDEEELDDMETTMTMPMPPVATTIAPKSQPSPRRSIAPASRIPLSAARGRPPSSLAAPSPEAARRRQSLASPASVRATIQPRTPPPPQPVFKPSPRVLSPEPELEEMEEIATEAEALALDDFLERANVQFMEDMFPTKRKSLGAADPTATGAVKTKATFAEQIVAAGALIPSLEMYRAMAREMRASMQENGRFLEDCETIVAQQNPPLFAHYLSATDAERDIMEAQFKLIKNYYRLEVRNEWYDYRCGVYSGEGQVCDALRSNLDNLEEDRAVVEQASVQFGEILPALKNREVQLTREVEQERTRQAELEECDQEHLVSLREAVAEQATQLDEQQREQVEVEQELARLDAKLAELDSRKRAAQVAIDNAKATSEGVKCFTKAEVYRLKGELEASQELHAWKLVAFNASELKLLHRNELGAIIALSTEGITNVELYQLPADDLPTYEGTPRMVLNYCFDRIRDAVKSTPLPVDATTFLQQLASRWTTAHRLVKEVMACHRHFPITLSALAKKSRGLAPSLRLSARVHCDRARASFSVQFEVTGEEVLAGDPDTVVEALGCAVEVRFGDVDREELKYVVRDRVARGGRGALLEAVTEAEAKYL